MCYASLSAAHDDVQYYNQISIDVSASDDIDNDTMQVQLFAEQEDVNADVAGDRVNRAVNTVLAKLKQYPDIKVKTESYSTYPVYNKSQIIGWRVKQQISLSSQDMAKLSQLLGALQRDMSLADISFDVSRQRRQDVTDRLIDEALTAFDHRATRVAGKIKGAGYRIVRMNISSSGAEARRPQFEMRALAAKASAAPVSPQTEGGQSTLTVRVSGTIELQ